MKNMAHGQFQSQFWLKNYLMAEFWISRPRISNFPGNQECRNFPLLIPVVFLLFLIFGKFRVFWLKIAEKCQIFDEKLVNGRVLDC